MAISMLTHGVVLQGMGTKARVSANRVPTFERLSVRVSARPPTLLPVVFEQPSDAPTKRQRDNHVTVAPNTTQTEGALQALTEFLAPAVLAFEPTLYLRPSDVDVPANPISPDSLDLLQLTGAQAGMWVVRVYVSESGAIDELELLDGRGSETNTIELLGILRTVRFTPALVQGRPVKSQKLLEFSFEPAPMPLTPVQVPPPAQGPSATGK